MVSVWNSLHSATLELVRSTPIKQRLIAAFRRHLCSVHEEHLPAEARSSFGQVMRCLAGVPPMRGEDAVTASVRKMSTQEADDCAALIVEIFGMLPRASDPPVGGQRPSAAVVQLRSVDSASAEFDVNALVAAH
jgi:hypothetical protein